jgi:lysophospholipase L1-like esterase
MLFMKSAPVISANFLERIANPASRFHSDYLDYRNSKITKDELIARLPHVAMVGDSVCMDVYISSAWSTFWRARTRRGGNWFLNLDPAPDGVRSVSKRLEEFTPFVAIEYAGIGALVDGERARQNFFRRILGTRNLSGQITRLLAARRFADLILISIGHNNVDWAWRCAPSELAEPEKRLQQISQSFRENFARQMRRLMEHARTEQHRVAVVVYGLINFEAYFNGREAAERLRAEDRRLYPHLETTYKYFRSFGPDYRRDLIRLAAMMNDQLRVMVNELNNELEPNCNSQIRYSGALARADLSRVELLHEIDGWHASCEGHNVLADAAFSDLGPSLEFLGIAPPSANPENKTQDRHL